MTSKYHKLTKGIDFAGIEMHMKHDLGMKNFIFFVSENRVGREIGIKCEGTAHSRAFFVMARMALRLYIDRVHYYRINLVHRLFGIKRPYMGRLYRKVVWKQFLKRLEE